MGGENAVRIDTRKMVEAAEKRSNNFWVLSGVKAKWPIMTATSRLTLMLDQISIEVWEITSRISRPGRRKYIHFWAISRYIRAILVIRLRSSNRLLGKNPATAKIGSMIPEVQALLKEETIRSLLESDKKAKKIFWLGQLVKHLISQQT